MAPMTPIDKKALPLTIDALLPLWSNISEPVWIQTICPKVVLIWSELSPFSLNFKKIYHVYRLFKFG